MYCIDSIHRNGEEIFFINEVKDYDRDLIIMLHGFPDDAYGFKDQIESLKEEYNIIAPFMHGVLNNKSVSEKRIALKEILLDVSALLKKFNPKEQNRVILMGHDLGCFTCVGTYEAFPFHIKKIVHINGLGLQQFYSRRFNISQWIKSYYVFLIQTSVMRLIVTKAFPEFFLRLIYSQSKISKDDQLLDNGSSVFRGIKIYKHLFRKIFFYIGAPKRMINVPSLFVWGNEDRFLDIPTVKEVNNFYGQGQIRVIKGGHWAHHSNPIQFNRIVNKWLRAVS